MSFLSLSGSIPPPGTSAYKAYLRSTGQDYSSGITAFYDQQANNHISMMQSLPDRLTNSVVSPVGDSSNVNQPPAVSYPSGNFSARSVSQGDVKPQTVDYINAELAKAYGMSAPTAYQEALSNTSYQRAVKDMKSAGLNPAVLFGAGRGSPANSAVYANDTSLSGSTSYRGYGKSSAKSQLFSSSMYSALSAIGGLVGIALTGKPDGFWIGSQTTQGAMGLLNAASSAAKNK